MVRHGVPSVRNTVEAISKSCPIIGHHMKIFKEKPGVISPDACWVAWHRCYLYTSDTLLGLLWDMLTNWNNDSRLIG